MKNNIIIELDPDPTKSVVKTEKGEIIGGVYKIDVSQEIGKPLQAIIYCYPDSIKAKVFKKNLKIK